MGQSDLTMAWMRAQVAHLREELALHKAREEDSHAQCRQYRNALHTCQTDLDEAVRAAARHEQAVQLTSCALWVACCDTLFGGKVDRWQKSCIGCSNSMSAAMVTVGAA